MADNHFKIHKGMTLAPQTTEPSNPTNGDVYYDSTLNKFRKYENGAWSDLASGSGSGGINYILNPDAEANSTMNWSTYDDGAVSEPIDGTGGSPGSFAFSVTNSTALRGNYYFNMLDSASSPGPQGEGVSTDFSIDTADTESVLQVSFDYATLGGYQSGYVRVFVYDIDNATLLGSVINDDDGDVLAHNMPSGKFVGQFYTTDSINYRLIFHYTTTDTTGSVLNFDNVRVGPIEAFVSGSKANTIETKILSSSVSTNGVITDLTFNDLEIGKTYEITGQFALFVNNGGTDTTIEVNATHDGNIVGRTSIRVDDGTSSLDYGYFSMSAKFVATTSSLTFVANSASGVSAIFGANTRADTYVQLEKRNDLQTNLVSNNQLNQQTIQVSGRGSLGDTISGASEAINWTEVDDPFNAWNINTFTAPRSGKYSFKGMVSVTSGTIFSVEAYINDVQDKTAGITDGGTTLKLQLDWEGYLEKGDELEFRPNTTITLENSTRFHWMSINSLPDFTSYGVLNPKTEYREVVYADTTGDITNGSLFVGPGPSEFDLELDEGEWLVGYSISVAQESLGGTGNMNMQAAIHLDGTLQASTTSYAFTSINSTNQGQYHLLSSVGKVTVIGNQDLQLRLQGVRTNASLRNRMISINWTGGLAGIDSAPKLWALKIK